MVNRCALLILGEKIRTFSSLAQPVNVIASKRYFSSLEKIFTRGNQGSILRRPAVYTQITNHCSDDRGLEDGRSVTGRLQYLALLREIRAQTKNQTSKEILNQTDL
jgi:hypothetical protein